MNSSAMLKSSGGSANSLTRYPRRRPTLIWATSLSTTTRIKETQMTYLVHKAVELDKVKKALRPTEQQLLGEHIIQLKYDGCCMVAIRDTDKVTLLSRTGEPVLSAKHIESALMGIDEGVYFGEYWQPGVPQNVLSGQFRKQDGTQYPDVQFVIFDHVTLHEWDQGYSDTGYAERQEFIPAALSAVGLGGTLRLAASLSAQSARHWMMLMNGAAITGYDGAIFRKPDGKWRKGDNGTNGEIIKIKPTLTLDLRVVGIETATGEKTGRAVYKVIVSLGNGKTQTLGSGVPHTESELPKIGDIVEVEAMSLSAHGLLREPRFKGIRYDKLQPDEV
ncbi:31L [Xanthomonas phage Xp10]|uniref:DNA ligase n=1 Tax=Xanthomonas phage Xp10 TaxID=2907956 RepID=Q7Y5I6_9CAUD|nr:DNA ligase; minimal catalytic domain [Xanthomonas phage Xp10]AAP58698.1 31L [Xanthomonas phage Xp10]